MSETPRPPDAGSPVTPAPADAKPPAVTKPDGSAASQLSPEEQMEKFARELKETDWGHQPC